jgi:hypothetical protein
MVKLLRGDLVCDLDKQPEPSIRIGDVEEVLADGVIQVTWKDGTTSERPIGRLAKFCPKDGVFVLLTDVP